MFSIHFDESHKNSLKRKNVPNFQWFPVHKNVLFVELIWKSLRFNDVRKAILVVYVCDKNIAKHKNAKLLLPKSLSKLVFPERHTIFNLWIYESLEESSESRHIPGFKGHGWGDRLPWAIGTPWMVSASPRLCSQSLLPSSHKGNKDISTSRNQNKNSNISNRLRLPFSPLLCYDSWLPFSPQSKKSEINLYVWKRNTAFFSQHNEYPALGRSDPTGGIWKWYIPSREKLQNTHQEHLE